MSRWAPASLVAAASSVAITVAAAVAVAASDVPRSGSPKPTVIYVCGEPRGIEMAKIEVHTDFDGLAGWPPHESHSRPWRPIPIPIAEAVA